MIGGPALTGDQEVPDEVIYQVGRTKGPPARGRTRALTHPPALPGRPPARRPTRTDRNPPTKPPKKPPPPPYPRQVDYPELRGMLHKLLTPISPRWDITLLHFRKTGQRAATALLGLRLPPADKPAFEAAVAELAMDSEFQFRELGGRDLEVFRMFV